MVVPHPDSLNKQATDSPSKLQATKENTANSTPTLHPYCTVQEAYPHVIAIAYKRPRLCTSNKDPPAGCLPTQSTFILQRAPLGAQQRHNKKAYATIFAYFSLASIPQSLLEQLLSLFEAQAVGALGIFVADAQGKPCLWLVHGLHKYPGPLAQHSPNKNKAFGYMDIEGEAGELVLVDSAMLSQTTASRVLLLEHHMAELDAHQEALSILAMPEGASHLELI
eukprot:jgi/Psemu1/8089/gm1.8089_g